MQLVARLRHFMLPLVEIDAAIPRQGLIYEIGSGHGAISDYLGRVTQRQLIGIDLDRLKTETANQKYKRANVSFEIADAVTYPYKPAMGVVLSDFLHHVDYDTQAKILLRIPEYLQRGGVLVIKEIDQDDSLRRMLSRIWDALLYPGDAIYYRRQSELIETLKNLGFTVHARRAVKWFPGSTHVYSCTIN